MQTISEYKHLTQDVLNKLRNDYAKKERILFNRYKNGNKGALRELNKLTSEEKELEKVAHKLNMYWY